MKISGKQLEMVVSKLRYTMATKLSGFEDYDIELFVTQEDPGTGIMVDCLTLKSTKESEKYNGITETMTVELYPSSEKQEPRACKIESFKITSKY